MRIVLIAILAKSAANAQDLECANCVDTTDIRSGAVTGGKVSTDAISRSKIAGQSVGNAEIVDASITINKLDAGLSAYDVLLNVYDNTLGAASVSKFRISGPSQELLFGGPNCRC